MIRLEAASVRFGQRWIFRGLDLNVTAGTCLALLGPNGRGKTTLLRSILGMQKLTEGRRTAVEAIGYVPQAGGEHAKYSVLDMVVMGRARSLGIFGSPQRNDYRTAREALQTVGLRYLAERSYAALSGGERQLVLVARALASGAKTIVLDEPSSALDLANQNRLLEIIAFLGRDPAFTLIFSTHQPQHALHVADETVLMMEDEIVRGPTSGILTEENLTRLYGVPVRRLSVEDGTDAFAAHLPNVRVGSASAGPSESSRSNVMYLQGAAS